MLNSSRKNLLKGCLIASLGVIPMQVNADDLSVTLGAGVVVGESIYDKSTDTIFLPILNASWYNVYINTMYGIGYDFKDLIGIEGLSVKTGFSYKEKLDLPSGEKYDGLSKDAYVNAMIDVRYDIKGLFGIEGVVHRDILNESDGLDVAITINKDIPMGDFLLSGKVGVLYEDDKLSKYNYGVSESEANEYRSAYSPDGSINPIVQLSLNYKYNEHISARVFTSYKLLSDEIKDSPLVENDKDFKAGVGISYTF